jgi:magnesium transporter
MARRRDPLQGLLPDPLNPVRTLRVMGRLVRRVIKKPGSPPGTLVHTGEKRVEEVRIRLMDYDGESFQEREIPLDEVATCFPFRDTATVTWINVEGLHDPGVVETIGRHFGLHPLVLEDVLSVGQRPKLEEYEGYLFVELNMLQMGEGFLVEDEQLSLVLGPGWVLTFQERPGDVLDVIRERIRSSKGRIRERGPDYLAYTLIDAVVDSYFGVLERVGDQAEKLEEEALDHPSPRTMHRIHEVRREVIVIRKSVWPVRDLLSGLLRVESPLVKEGTRVFLRDVYDHAIQAIDTVENLRDVAGSLMELHLSTLSQRSNEVMKVLTIMATIFIPLTFIVGVYGMNFEFMPELGVWWAYPAVWIFMLAVAGGMLAFFRRRGWL